MNLVRRTLFAAAAFALVALVVGSAGLQNAQAQEPTRRTITVTGIGSVSTTPDVGYIRVGVNIDNPNLSEALQEASTKMEAVLAALEAAGIAETDIATDQYSIFREDRYDPRGEPQPVYRVINIVLVTVREMGKVGDVLNATINAGANAINSVNFGVLDIKPAESEARKLALADAEARARELAASIGAELGEVLAIQEGTGFSPYGPVAYGLGGGGGGAGPISSGELQVSVNLNVVFALK